MYTASAALIEALSEAGVSFIFANLGSDHSGIIESLAEARATGRPAPRLITSPNEMVALSAAHGFAQVTGRPQVVLVHVECGTQALAGALHNAAKGRVPVLIFAGASPFTQDGEMRGGRNEFIQWIQDVFDQRGLARGYVKYDNEIRTGRNIKQMIFRALQFARSDPKGPVYLMAAREVLEEEIPPIAARPEDWPPIAPSALPSSDVETIIAGLLNARFPLVVTSYIGRNPVAVTELIRLCERLAVGALESVPGYVNYPADSDLYQGNQWNEPEQNRALDEADFVLVIDSDVPWIPAINKPRASAVIYQIDVDPLKEQMPLWGIPARRVFRADAATALRQINERLDAEMVDGEAVKARLAHYARLSQARREKLLLAERLNGDIITPEYLTACVRQHIDEDTILLNEGVTNFGTIIDHLSGICQRGQWDQSGQWRGIRAGHMFTSGGGSLGWNGGAAIGVKLAYPDKTVVCLTGDGSYMFSVPSAVHWIARRYQTPFLQIIYNNRGWKAPKLSMLAIHPDGYASRAAGRNEDIGVSFDPPPDYSGIAAAAGDAFARIVRRPEELNSALDEALNAARHQRRCAVVDVWIAHL
ncbi:MAG: thiamine pyrophosphate-requiring protein [Chloracidobacterium sp.]|nr:thiamine pyrophosphate-requiring protein [Chloracidobacterium sp.]